MNTPQSPLPEEVTYGKIAASLRRSMWFILVVSALAAFAVATYYQRQPKVYEARAVLAAIVDESGNPAVGSTLVTGPALPEDTVQHVIHSRQLVQDIIRELNRSSLSDQEKAAVSNDLRRELTTNAYARLHVTPRLNASQNGTYTITARGETPIVARELANAATAALLSWDAARAARGVQRALNSVEQQLVAIDQRIAEARDRVEQRTLVNARSDVLQRIAQLAVIQTAAVGPLSRLSEAVAPAQAAQPRPYRNAAITFVVVAVLASLAALLLDAMRNTHDDAPGSGRAAQRFTVLGRLPKLPPARQGLDVNTLNSSEPVRRALESLCVNMLLQQGNPLKRVVIAGATASTDTRVFTALIALTLAQGGRRVLVIDGGGARANPDVMWAGGPDAWRPLPGSRVDGPPARDVRSALDSPSGAQARRVADRVDYLPAADHANSVAIHPNLESCLERWSEGYDIVLVDGPPLVEQADAFAFTNRAGGLLIVAGPPRAANDALAAAAEGIETAGVAVIGTVITDVGQATRERLDHGRRPSEPRVLLPSKPSS